MHRAGRERRHQRFELAAIEPDALLAVVGALIVAYHFTPNRRVLWAILPHSVLTILFVSVAWLGRGLDHVTWTFAVYSWFQTIWYVTYVFGLAIGVLPTGK